MGGRGWGEWVGRGDAVGGGGGWEARDGLKLP